MAKVLISDKLSQKGVKILKDAGFEVDEKFDFDEDQLAAAIKDYDALVIRSGTKATAKIIEGADNLKIIARAGVGVDNVDLDAATKKGVIVVNSPEGNTIAAAEHTVAMTLAMARNIPQAHGSLTKEHKWDRAKYKGVEVFGKTLGIVGLGKIGSHVAKCLSGMGMKVSAYDPFASKEHAESIGVDLKKLDEIIRESDFISFHIPKTEETKGMINAEKFSMMKDGVRIVNCARGGIIVESDLAEACKSGKVAAAAVDVFEVEPTTESPMFDCENIVAVPHLGASTEEAQINVAVDVCEQAVAVLNGGDASAPVNIPSLKPHMVGPVKKYINLAEKVSSLAAQLVEDVISEIKVEYFGEISDHDVAPLNTVILKGVLDSIEEDGCVNFVNAPLLAKERGIKITEIKSEATLDYANLIRVTIVSKKETRSVAGTMFENIGDVIVAIDGYKVNIRPEGYLLVAPNEDKPGIIGEVSTLLGSKGVNIAQMVVGRQETGGNAVMVIIVDSKVDKEVLSEIEKFEKIRGQVKEVKL